MGCSWSCKIDSYCLAVIWPCRAIIRPNDCCVIMDPLLGLIPGSRLKGLKICFKKNHILSAETSLIIITFQNCFPVSEDMLDWSVNSIFILDPNVVQTEFSALRQCLLCFISHGVIISSSSLLCNIALQSTVSVLMCSSFDFLQPVV